MDEVQNISTSLRTLLLSQTNYWVFTVATSLATEGIVGGINYSAHPDQKTYQNVAAALTGALPSLAVGIIRWIGQQPRPAIQQADVIVATGIAVTLRRIGRNLKALGMSLLRGISHACTSMCGSGGSNSGDTGATAGGDGGDTYCIQPFDIESAVQNVGEASNAALGVISIADAAQ